MADPAPTPTQNPEPKQTPPPAAAPSPAVQQRYAKDDDLMEVTIYGKKQVVPVGVAKKDYQTSAAGREAIEAAKKIRAEAHVDHEHAERWRKLEYDLRTDPERAFAGLERLAGVTRQAHDDSDSVAPPTHDPKTRELEEKVRRLEASHNQASLRAGVNEALDAFPVFQQDPVARRHAEKQILASLVIDPNTSPLDAAREVHTELLELRSGTMTQQRDQRVEHQTTLPTVPAGVGMPDLSDIGEGKASDLKDGTFRKNFVEAARRFGAMVSGQGGT